MSARGSMPRAHAAAGLLAAVLVAAGCGGEPPPGMPVSLSGSVSLPEGVDASGTVEVRLYHAWALEGILRHPLEFIESFETGLGEFSHTFEYPAGIGEGLVVHAWLDTDGDGVLCTPTVREDIAGLAEAKDFPADSVRVEIVLTEPCAGADWFYPPAP